MISGYRFMWVIVMFDMPVLTKKQRKQATKFRTDLLDLGFEMSQYSIYWKFCGSRASAEAAAGQVSRAFPGSGRASVLTITDKQMETMRILTGKGKADEAPEKRKQLLLL